MAWEGKMTSMEMSDDDKIDAPMPYPMPNKPDFPCGLRLCLCSVDLAKLGLDADCEIGDTIEFRAMARVTHISKSDDAMSGPQARVELQIESMALDE